MNENVHLSRRQFLKQIAGISGIGMTLSISGLITNKLGANSFFSEKNFRRDERPNVLFILVDDHVVESLRQGALMPNIRRMYEKGVTFTRAYCVTSVCTPARYNCLTGRYSSRCQNEIFRRPSAGLFGGMSFEGQTWVHWNCVAPPGEKSIANILRNEGYATGIIGKLGRHFLSDRIKEVTDPYERQKIFAEDLKNAGFDYAGAISVSNLHADVGDCHNPEWQVQCAFEFFEKNKDRPFYLYFATHLLHMPQPSKFLKVDPRKAYEGMILDEVPKVQPSRKSVLQRVKKAGLPEKMAGATWLDDSIGALFNKLEELGVAENTMVIFLQDNGHNGGKASLYEGGINISPACIYWPRGVKNPGRECDSLVENVDFVATILDVCGITPPADYKIDGVSLLPILNGKKERVRDSIYCEIGYTRAIVTERWKYLAFRVPPSRQLNDEQKEIYRKEVEKDKRGVVDPQLRVTHLHRKIGGCNSERNEALKHYRKNFFDPDQLYDLKNDPNEKNNLANDPQYTEILSNLKKKLREYLLQLPGTFGEFKTIDDLTPNEKQVILKAQKEIQLANQISKRKKKKNNRKKKF